MIKILIDINLPPAWAQVLSEQGWDAVHWSAIGDPRAPDHVVLTWARDHQYVVFTHDLDFGTLLALTHDSGPSVVQVRTHDVLPDRLAPLIVSTVRRYESELRPMSLAI